MRVWVVVAEVSAKVAGLRKIRDLVVVEGGAIGSFSAALDVASARVLS